MKKHGQTEGVKGKVLSGFFLLLIIALGAVIVVIQLASQLSPPDSGVSLSVIKLGYVSNMLSKQIEADGQARAYITTGERRYLLNYRKQYKEIKKLADSLKYSSTLHPEQYKRMLVVDSLLSLKKATMENFFRMSTVREVKPEKQGQQVTSTPQTSDSIQVILKPIDHPVGVTQVKEKAPVTDSKNVFKKLWESIAGKKTKIDSLQKQPQLIVIKPDSINTFSAKRDSTLEMVKSQLIKMSEKDRIERQMNVERELLLLKTNQVIMDEIRNVLILFEKEEINRAITGAGHSREVLKRLWNTAMVLTSVGLLTMLIFVILIWKDLARSAFYRKQLEKARLLAEGLLKVKEQFLANMSHEIRTPITSIIGFTERLSETRLSIEQKDYLNYINTSSDHLLGLIDDLLDYSRIESGKFNLDSIPFSPSDLLSHAYETMRQKAESRGLVLRFESQLPELVALNGDPLRIRQIVYNLLNNSIKFTEKGSITLAAHLQMTSTKSALLTISVVDTGIGIPPDKQEEIFEEFTQVDAGITRKYGGSGLGLAICRKLTGLMNGSIKLESNPGEGSSVVVELPLEFYHGILLQEKPHKSEARPDLSGFEILLAEDDPTTSILISGSLRSMGASVDEAANGEAAWKLFKMKNAGYHLIMTDIQMPLISGPELAALIGKFADENGITKPVIMGLTAHAMPEDLSDFRDSGIDDFLIKPFRSNQLDDILTKLLNIKNPDKPSLVEDPIPNGRQLNFETFMKFAGNDKEALGQILASLADNMHNTSTEMQQAYDSGQLKDLVMLAHRILPNMRNLGATEEVRLLQLIEALRSQSSINQANLAEPFNKLRLGMKEIETLLRNQLGK